MVFKVSKGVGTKGYFPVCFGPSGCHRRARRHVCYFSCLPSWPELPPKRDIPFSGSGVGSFLRRFFFFPIWRCKFSSVPLQLLKQNKMILHLGKLVLPLAFWVPILVRVSSNLRGVLKAQMLSCTETFNIKSIISASALIKGKRGQSS